MSLKARLISIFALALVMPLSAHAMLAEPRSLEVNGFFTFSHTSVSFDGGSEGSTLIDIEPALGYFFTPSWEVLGKLVLINDSGFGDDSSESHIGLTADVFYHFATEGSMVPFVGAGLGILTNGGDVNDGPNEGDTSLIAPELFAGVRFPFKEIVSINLTAGYRHTTSYLGFDDVSANEFFLMGGFSFFFRGGFTQ